MASSYLVLLTLILQTLTSSKYKDCNHYYDQPIDICFSSHSSKGLLSYKYTCSINSTSHSNAIIFHTFNNTDSCKSSSLINSTLVYNLSTSDYNSSSNTKSSPFISCRGDKSCPFFRGRYFITKILTDSPTSDPTRYPSTIPTPSPSHNPTVINGTLYPSPSPTRIPSISPTNIPSFSPTTNNTFSASIPPTASPIDYGPYLANETCAKTPLNDYYQDVVYVIDVCMPVYTENNTVYNGYNKNNTFISRKCSKDSYGNLLFIKSILFGNSTCNNSIIEDSQDIVYDAGECYNVSYESDKYDDIKYIAADSERDYYKLFILECNYIGDSMLPSDEYFFYEIDLIASWIIFMLSSLMLLVYTLYIIKSCRRVQKRQTQYNESGILVLDDNFSESRLAVLTFQWFALFTLFLNAVFNYLNSWSIIDLEDEDQCNLMMSALDLTWHWGKGFFYISLMSRIVLIMEGLSDRYAIPPKILKLFAFEIVAYFLLTPILDLVTTRADHHLYQFTDERGEPDEIFYVCGEIIEYWISFLLLFGDLVLSCSTIAIYLYALGELIIEPIRNQKLIDIVIRYGIFTIFAAIFIMIGNGIWATNNVSVCRYIDCIFITFSIMFMLSLCTSCYLQCCSNCHKKYRTSYIMHFLDIKEKLIAKELKEIKNNPKYILKSYDTSFDEKLTQILSVKNLASASIDRYHQNVAIHHANSSVKSKRKLRKIKKKLRRQWSAMSADRGGASTVKLDNRDLQTMEKLLTFASNSKFKKNDDSKQFAEQKNQYLASDDEENTQSVSVKRVRNKNALKQNHGLLSHLDPSESNLPTSLTIAIHSSVVETVQNTDDDQMQQLMKSTDAYKIHKRMDELWTKVDTFWNENQILFPRRSPTIYPGTAYKLSKKEKFALDQRTGELADYSNSEEHSDSADSEDFEQELQVEQKWPNPSRKYGHIKNLEQIYKILGDLNEKELITIWDFFDKDKKKRIDYKETLVKLLGAFFLLYFRKKIFGKQQQEKDEEHKENMSYINLDEQPPRFDELEPLLVVLAKYIRDYLRKKKKRFINKKDYLKNMKKYLKFAIEKRTKLMANRNNKLQKHSTMLSLTNYSIDTFAGNDSKVEEETSAEDDAYVLSALQMLEHINQSEAAPDEKKEEEKQLIFRDDEAAQIELEQMMSGYVPRESANKYGLSVLKDTAKEPEMESDVGVEQEAAHKKQPGSLISGMFNIIGQQTAKILQAIQDDVATPAAAEDAEDVVDVDGILMAADAEMDGDTPAQQTNLVNNATSSMSFDIDALIDDMDEIDDLTRGTTQRNVVVEEEEDKKAEDAQYEHVKDTAGTEIINLDAVMPRKSKVVLIEDKDIKQVPVQLQEAVGDSLEIMDIDDLIGDAMDSMDVEEVEEHKASDTIVLLADHKSASSVNRGFGVEADGQQMRDDVLDVCFAVDDSDEEDGDDNEQHD